MRKKLLTALMILLFLAVILFSANFIYFKVTYDPNNSFGLKQFGTFQSFTEQFAKSFLPELSDLEVHFVNDSKFLSQKLKVNGYYIRNNISLNKPEVTKFYGLYANKKFDDTILSLRKFAVTDQKFIKNESTEKLWDSMNDNSYSFAYFKVNKHYILDNFCTQLINDLKQIQNTVNIYWAATKLLGTGTYIGMPLASETTWKYTVQGFHPFIFLNMIKDNLQSADFKWLAQSGLFPELANAKLDEMLNENQTVEVVMLYAKKSELKSFYQNPDFVLCGLNQY